MIEFQLKKLPKVNLNWWATTQKQWAPILAASQKPFWHQETDPTTGRPWQSLQPNYAMNKLKRYPGEPILRATGTMQDRMRIKPNKEGFSVLSTLYGQYHQYGTSKMPARPWVGVPDTALSKLPPIAWKNILKHSR
jgi:phage gpG-like protein